MSTDVLLEGPKNTYQRLRYMGDETWAQTQYAMSPAERAFQGGYIFFATHEFSVPAASPGTTVIKVVATKNTIVRQLTVDVTDGELNFQLVSGGTEGSAFDEPITIFPANATTICPQRESGVTMTNGGSQSGGIIIDEFFATGQGSQTTGNIALEAPLGFAPGTFYLRLVNVGDGPATGVFRARWESL